MNIQIKRTTCRSRSGKISEFGPVLFILLFIGLFPFLNLVWLASAYGIIALAANQFVAAAAVQSSYDKALAGMSDAALSFNNSVWNSFAGISPVGGYSATGSDLYLNATSIASHQIHEWGPNTSAPPPIDTANNVWEFKTRVMYKVRPLTSLSAVPFIGSVPGLGKPVTMTFVAHKLVEHPEGLAQDTLTMGFSTGQTGSLKLPSSPPPSGTGGGATFPTGVTWRDPKIYDQIAQAGQTVVAQDVLTVPANQKWVNTNLTVSAGQTVWVDTRADGFWRATGRGLIDADGYHWFFKEWRYWYGSSTIAQNVNLNSILPGMLIGCVGTPPSPNPSTPLTTGPFFPVGNTLTNYPITGSGPISLQLNENWIQCGSGPMPFSTNQGQQIVRIIITH